MNFTVLCVSVKDSARREKFSSTAQRHGMPFSFVDAVTPDDVRMGRIPPGVKIDLSDLRWTFHEKNDPRRQQSPLLFTELACAYSHIGCWQLAARQPIDYLAMFED